MMTGAFLGGAAAGKVVLVDGFISSAAALAAIRLAPSLAQRLVFAHTSAERGHRLLLAAVGAPNACSIFPCGSARAAAACLPLPCCAPPSG